MAKTQQEIMSQNSTLSLPIDTVMATTTTTTISSSASTASTGTNTFSPNQIKLQTLKQKKIDLEKKLNEKNNLLQEICRKEAQLIGIYPSSIVDTATKQSGPLTLPRKVGTSFKLSESLLNNSREDDINNILLQKNIQQQICKASLKLSNDTNQTKSIRRAHKQNYEAAQQKLLAINHGLTLIKRRQMQQQHPHEFTSPVINKNYLSSSSYDVNLNKPQILSVMTNDDQLHSHHHYHHNLAKMSPSSKISPNYIQQSQHQQQTITYDNQSSPSSSQHQEQQKSLNKNQQLLQHYPSYEHDHYFHTNNNTNNNNNNNNNNKTVKHHPLMQQQQQQFNQPDPIDNYLDLNHDYSRNLENIEQEIAAFTNYIDQFGQLKMLRLQHKQPMLINKPIYYHQQQQQQQQGHSELNTSTNSHGQFVTMMYDVAPQQQQRQYHHQHQQHEPQNQFLNSGLGGYWMITENNDKVWCTMDSRYSSLDRKNQQCKVGKSLNSQIPIKSSSLGNFDFITKHDEISDTISISSLNSEHKKQREKIWCETSLDSLIMKPKLGNNLKSTSNNNYNWLDQQQQQQQLPQYINQELPTNYYKEQLISDAVSDKNLITAENISLLERSYSQMQFGHNNSSVASSSMHNNYQQSLNTIAAGGSSSSSISLYHQSSSASPKILQLPSIPISTQPSTLNHDTVRNYEQLSPQISTGNYLKRTASNLSGNNIFYQQQQIVFPHTTTDMNKAVDIRIESPKNMTVVQQAKFMPYKEITKPFEMSDFYKYSIKFRKKNNISQGGVNDNSLKSSSPATTEIATLQKNNIDDPSIRTVIYQPPNPSVCHPISYQ